MTNSLNDGLSKPDQLADNAVTSPEMAYGQVGLGSPTAIGNIVQVGQGTLSTGSTVEVTFGTAFLGVPRVMCSMVGVKSSAGVVTVSGTSVTGFVAFGDLASAKFDWIAAGSGTI